MNIYFRSRRLAASVLCAATGMFLCLFVFAGLSFPVQGQSPQPDAAISIPDAQPHASGGNPAGEVRRAWQRARDAGVYHFATDLVQTTYPVPAVANIGRSPQVDTLYLDGDVNLPEETVQMRMWQDGGAPAARGAELRVEKDRGYARQAGGAWEEVADVAGSFGMGSDPLSYLASVKNVVSLGTETRALPAPESSTPDAAPQPSSVTVTRYSFDFDGPAFAVYLRDQLERQLASRGELPLGVSLDAAGDYRAMTGQGEVWVDARGLPLRLTVHLAYPPRAGEQRIEADIQTDFSSYPVAATASSTILQSLFAQTGGSLRRQISAADWQDIAVMLAIIIAVTGLSALVSIGRRSRRVYWAVALAVIVSMVILPLPQAVHAGAFYKRMATQQAEQEVAQDEQQATRELQAERTESTWDAHRDPLAGPPVAPQEQLTSPVQPLSPRLATATPTPAPGRCDSKLRVDTDGDGLTDLQECVIGTSDTTADFDGDGLTDGQEVLRLGIDPTIKDTDGDGISDYVEVAGFDFAGQHWYTDPANPDTNNDGRMDTEECSLLVDVSTPPTITQAECDNDIDGTLDLFDRDDDGDGVADRVDLSPTGVLGRNGKTTRPDGSYFDAANPLQLSILGLLRDKPVFVDLQLRPITATHLTYALNVLDWPAGDADGQIQHYKNSTFADTQNLQIRDTTNPANANGDMRLIPMLEIQMDGASVPLKLTGLPPVTVPLSSSMAISATATFQQSGTSVSAALSYRTSGTYTTTLYSGNCSALGAPVYTMTQSTTILPTNLVNIANGDHALVMKKGSDDAACADMPNLINGPYTNKVVDMSVLDPYGISVREVSTQSTTLLAYVPLNMAQDDTGGGRAAFSARMLYWPGEGNAWEASQQYRVVWTIQMLTDDCIPPTPEEQAADEDLDMTTWCADAAHRTQDEVRVVQIYPERWYATGLAVREDHGLDVAVIYENASKPTADLQNQDALWMPSLGLSTNFVTGRDCEDALNNGDDYDPARGTCHSDNLTDLAVFMTNTLGVTVANRTIAGTWGFPNNPGVSYTQSLGIPADELRVQNFTYLHEDYRAVMAMTTTNNILQTFPVTSTPTLMFAQSEHYRSAGLEAFQGTRSITATLDSINYQERTINNLSWMPYRYKNNKWEVFPAEEYWDRLAVQLRGRFMQLYPDDGDEAANGRMLVARSYYITLMQGVAGNCTEKPCKAMGKNDTPTALINATKLVVGKGVSSVVKTVMKALIDDATKTMFEFDFLKNEWMASEVSTTDFKLTAASIGRGIAGPWGVLFSKSGMRIGAALISVGVVVAGAVAAIAITFSALAKPMQSAIQIVVRVLLALNVALQVLCVVNVVVRVISGVVKWTKAAITAFTTNLSWAKVKAGVVGLVIALIATWGAFIVSAAMSGMPVRSLSFTNGLAGTIGASIAIFVMFVVLAALGPLGSLIGALIGLIDALVAMLCNAFMTAEQQAKSKVAQLFCGGISGLLTKFFTWMIHSGTIMVDMDPKEGKGPPWYPRLAFFDFDSADMVDPNAGFIAGNAIKYSVSVTNTIDLVKTPVTPQELFWSWQFDEKRLATSTFDYRLQSTQSDYEKTLERHTMEDEWLKTDGGQPFYHVWDVKAADGISLPTPGINQQVSLYLSEAYAVPRQECWGFFYTAFCYITRERTTQHYDFGASMFLDMLPATLDGFYSLTPWEGGYALGWGEGQSITHTLHFPRLMDADGDGLVSTADANDLTWDSDGDGLRDGYEVGMGSNPSLADSDDDGLSDPDEVRWGANPVARDSDGDGLRDGEEVAGWDIVVAVNLNGSLFKSHVYADPLAVDADGDSLTDFQERLYGFNPWVPNDPRVLTLNSKISEIGSGGVYTATDFMVKPGASLPYTATVSNLLENRYAQGLLSSQAAGALQNQGAPQSFVLYPQQEKSMTGTLNVNTAAASGVYSLTQVAAAQIIDWSQLSGGATLWLPFDEGSTATTWQDRSGNRPAHDAACAGGSGCATAPAGGRYGGALDLSNNAGYARAQIGINPTQYGVSFWFRNTHSQSDAALFSTNGSQGLQLYLANFSVCAKIYYEKPLGSGQFSANQACANSLRLQDSNWHHVALTYGGDWEAELRVDGAQFYTVGIAGTGPAPASTSVNIGGSEAGIGQFSGLIDDVRLFSHRLTDDDIRTLMSDPVFRISFESDTSWTDSSIFYAPVTCTGLNCPNHDTAGIVGRGASFNGHNFLDVGGANSGQLNLSGGRFTLATWINPKTGCSSDGEGQMILGGGPAYPPAYPSLVRNGPYIGYGFTAGTTYYERETNAILTANTWQHLVATFDIGDRSGTWKFYVNGVLKWEDYISYTGMMPNSSTTFRVGAASATTAGFCGLLDELQVFNQALSVEDVQQLAMDSATALHLPLDEAPGATNFKDAHSSALQGHCDGAACPTAGVGGRVQQAAWFTSASRQYLSLPNSIVSQVGNRLAVAAWVMPTTLSGVQRIVSSARTNSPNGWSFAITGSNLQFSTFGVKDYILSGVTLQAGRWTHVAAVLDQANAVTFYVNGASQGTVAGAAAGNADKDDALLIGATTAAGSSTPIEFFNGQLDDVWVFTWPVGANGIDLLYKQAPVMQLRLDEQRGATRFADVARPGSDALCSGAGCPLTGEGVPGQLGLAAQFDGQNDMIELAHRTDLAPDKYSVGAWVKPTDIMTSTQDFIAKWSYASGNDYRLRISGGPSIGLRVTFYGACAGTSYVSSASPLVKGGWNHVMATYDAETMRLYINGSLSASAAAYAGTCTNTSPVHIGSYDGTPNTSFSGRLDEVVLYNQVLSAQRIHEIFLNESSWVQDRQTRNLWVDGVPPKVQLTVPGIVSDGKMYLANQPVQLGVTAVDTTTDVSRVSLVVYPPSGSIATVEAQRCGQLETSQWCPTFSPSLAGSYRLNAEAWDMVGNVGTSAIQEVFVDSTPPTITLTVAQNNQVNAIEDKDHPGRWLVPLAGTVSDPGSGSGIPPDGVRVTVRKPNGDLAGADGQVATIAGNAWSIQYVIQDKNPTQAYDVTAQARDRIGQMPGISDQQLALHSASVTDHVTVHAQAPAGQQDRSQAPSSASELQSLTTLRGIIMARPVPLELSWTTGSNGAGEGISLDCTAPVATALYTAAAGTFSSGMSYTWEGSAPRDGACRVTLPVSAGSGDMTGTVKVCGTQVASWSAGYANNQTVAFTAAAATCPADLPTAGIDAVDIAYTPNLPGSPFINEAPAPGLIVHLPLEDGPDQQNNLSFRDVSGGDCHATCSGSSCPAYGQAGHRGNAALFDGVDDSVSAGSNISLTNTSFSVAFWARRGTTGVQQAVLGQGVATTNNGLFIGFRASNTFAFSFYNNSLDTPSYTDINWHHWTCTYDAATRNRIIYRDGVQVAQGTASAGYQGSGNLYIGTFMPGSFPFNGLIDEVRVYSRTLAAADVNALYLGTEAVLALPFEERSAFNGTLLPDVSGWQRSATLSAGANDKSNKATTGKVGQYALHLDGADDYVNLGDVNETDAFGDFTISQWFSLDALGVPTLRDEATPVNKGPYTGPGWAVLVDRTIINTSLHKVRLFLNGGVAAAIPAPAGGWQVGQWYHYAFTRSGTTLKGYLDGVEKVSVTNSSVPAATSSPLLLGTSGSAYNWDGKLDDLRIYRNGLPAAEVQMLYRAGWQSTTLAQRGATVQAGSWQSPLPSGMEGSFKVDLRTWDTAGHSAVVREREATWSGQIDNLAPRVVLYRTASGADDHYTAVAVDYNLVTDGFVSPCGTTAAATYFQSPWYLALASSSPKLYQLTADCTLPAGTAVEQATAYDSFGNHVTVGVTTAGAPPGDLLALPELQRWQALRSSDLTAAEADETPVISFVPTVLTATAYYEPRTVDVTGLITGSQRVASLDIGIGGAGGPAYLSIPDPAWPYTMTWRFPWLLGNRVLPDGLAYSAAATATVVGGQTFTVTGDLVLDVVAPGAVAPTLTSGGLPVAAGSTIRTPGAELQLAWTPSNDGSGLGPYLVQWTAQTTDTVSTVLTAYPVSGALVAPYTVGEAQRVTVQVGSQDTHGNQRWQGLGSVYVDGPRTPDFIQIGTGRAIDSGWLGSGCSLLGTDHRGEQTASARGPQQLYATWDQQALRLAWTGANWNTDGDLFIYLDSGAGGATSVFTPYPPPAAGTVVSLPDAMGADSVIWVEDGSTATLLRWDSASSAWGSPVTLSESQYRFAPSLRGGQTDLYLPFELLGLSNSSGLGLVAFAAEEPGPDAGLLLWATAPAYNPANSPRANPLAANIPPGARGSLSHFYRWAGLGDGMCPNGSDGSQPGAYFADANPQITIATNPAGGTLTGLGGGAFWLGDLDALQAELFSVLKAAYPAVGNNQQIDYTIRYRNRGSQTAQAVRVELSAAGALRLLDTALELGDILPGAEASATFRAITDQSQANTTLAAMRGLIYDASHTSAGVALERFWAVHRLDGGAPDALAIESHGDLVGPGQTLLAGSAHDESGITQVNVEVQTPSGGTSLLSCSVPSASDGRWSCPWDVSASNGGVPPADGSQITLRVQATDPFGHSAWSRARTLEVDSTPPTVTLDLTGIKMYPGNVVHRQGGLQGEADDEHGVAGVEVCADDVCKAAGLQTSGSGTAHWSVLRQDDVLRDHVLRNVAIYAIDTLGNRTLQPVSFSLYVDDVPPAISASQLVSQVPLGSKQTVLAGTVSDGGTVAGMWVRSVAPDGKEALAPVARDGDGWSFDLPAGLPGQYVLQVEATDEADNMSAAGPYLVNVTCTDARPVVASLIAEPTTGSAQELALRIVLGNEGAQPLPAAMPVDVYIGEQPLWSAVTTAPLAPGATQLISTTWAVTAPGDYDVSVSLNGTASMPGSGERLVLCQTPATARQTVGVRDVALDSGWNLVAPPVSPFNTEIEVVQRPISGDYRLIIGYDNGFLTYDPTRPAGANTLHTMDETHAYWIDALPPATLRLAGAVPAEDQPLALAAGWNLAGYPARRVLPISEALAGISGHYSGVLGFEGTALSYYPDLAPEYNTLSQMAPVSGYWIRATQAITLQYPVGPVSATVQATAATAVDWPALIGQAEHTAGVHPTYQWMNFYGRPVLPGGAVAPTGTVVLAVDPQGTICGATVIVHAEHYGLLACYGDDPTTPQDEGALPGDTISLFSSADGVHPTQPIATGRWTTHGDRQMAPAQTWYFPFIYR